MKQMGNQEKGAGKMRVGYLMQNGAPDLTQVSGPQLHTLAVITELKKLGHYFRLVANQNFKLGWTDDLDTWSPPHYEITKNRVFRSLESAVRRIQSELNLPFLGLFDSFRYADACTNHLKGFWCAV